MGDRTGRSRPPVAPLIVKDKVIVGIAGGEFAIRGFLDAYDVPDRPGKRIWRFWTVPGRRESPAAKPGRPKLWQRGGGPTWLTGTYDPRSISIYSGTGNPTRTLRRRIARATTCTATRSIAIDADKAHDTLALPVHAARRARLGREPDPGAREPHLGGQARKVVMVANRNGFFYVLDRTTAQFLCAKPFVKQTWAKEIGADGRPVEMPDQRPTATGTRTCPICSAAPISCRRHTILRRRHQFRVFVVVVPSWRAVG